jgi:hypothetical protein
MKGARIDPAVTWETASVGKRELPPLIWRAIALARSQREKQRVYLESSEIFAPALIDLIV